MARPEAIPAKVRASAPAALAEIKRREGKPGVLSLRLTSKELKDHTTVGVAKYKVDRKSPEFAEVRDYHPGTAARLGGRAGGTQASPSAPQSIDVAALTGTPTINPVGKPESSPPPIVLAGKNKIRSLAALLGLYGDEIDPEILDRGTAVKAGRELQLA
ncbi:MAG: hypothetical protein ABH823_04005 [bacterium]